MPTPVSHDPRRRRWSRWRRPRTLRGWLAAIAACSAAAVIVAWLLARMTPPWYAPLDPSSDRVIDAFERGQNKLKPDLHNTIQRVPLGDQRWTITQEEVNSVLALSFAAPLNPDGTRSYPPTAGGEAAPIFSGPYVIFSPGQVTIAARTTKLPGRSPFGGVASVTLSVKTIPAAPSLARQPGDIPQGLIRIEHAWAGDLPIPTSLVTAKVRAQIPGLLAALDRAGRLGVPSAEKVLPQVQAAILAAERGDPFPMRYTVEHRTFIVKEITVSQGALSIVLGPVIPAAVLPHPLH